MNKAYHRDLRRTVAAHKKRFFSLAAITALGVAMFAGLQASCRNLRLSADALYDSQNLFDLRIQSTLGLTGEDLSALAALEGVERAEGGVSLTVKAGDAEGKAEARSFEEGGLNQPYLVEGELPRGPGQAAVTQSCLTDTGAQLGDTVTLTLAGEEEEDGPGLARESFVLTGVVLDPMDLNNRGSAAAFRVTGGADYTFFLTPEDLTGVDVVVFGHSHRYVQEERDGILWLNPGSCGPRRFHQEITMMMAQVDQGAIRVEKISIPHEVK